MPRRRKEVSYKREVGVDPIYGSALLQKFINVVMRCGKKNVARRIVYDTIDILAKKSSGDTSKALAVFDKAFKQVVPIIEVRSRRVGGSVYQIPREVSADRGRALGMRWLIDAAKVRSGKTMSVRLAAEILDAQDGRGGAIKKRLDVHKMAEANRAFSHYAW